MTKPFKLALIQMEVRGGEKEWNIPHAAELIAEAAGRGAEIVLLPECLDLGWTHPSSRVGAEPIPGGSPYEALARAARDHSVYVCAGLTERSDERIFNAAVLIGPDGSLLCKHRKLNELEIGHACYDLGDRLNVAHTEYGTIGLMICADGFAQDRVISRALCYMGADVILSPCAWAVPADHDNTNEPYGELWKSVYIPTAREFSCAIFGASNVGRITGGPWENRLCIGCSLAIDATGTELLQGPYGVDAECILYVEVEPVPRPARGDAWAKMLSTPLS